MKKIKKIVIGTYKFQKTNYGYSSYYGCGGTNRWNDLIEQNGLMGEELEVILVPKKK